MSRHDDQFNELLARFQSGTYTPTLTGMAIGTGGGATNSADWAAVNCGTFWQLHIEGRITFGTTGTTLPTSTLAINLPSGFTWAGQAISPSGRVIARDASAGYRGFTGEVINYYLDASKVELLFENASGTYNELVVPQSTVPFTWAAWDDIYWTADLLVTRS